MKAAVAWLEDRTGLPSAFHAALMQPIPGGAKWRYAFGTVLLFAFCVQVVTGLFLMTAYSPSVESAWASVHHISYTLNGGWLLRGIHHFTAQAVVAMLALHMLQVVLYGAYRAPREVTFWLGLVLLQLTLAMSLTGYLLPWDQRGYRATQVSTNLAGITPVAGADIKRIAVGGDAYGNATLTRFYALHVGFLPALIVFFLILHVAVFRRHGVTAPETARGTRGVSYWPDQALRDACGCMLVMLTVLGLVFTVGGPGGAELGPPAQPNVAFEAARPEWYFLFLFQTLKYCHGELGELIGAQVIPGAIMGVFALMPLTGRWRAGQIFNMGFAIALGIAIVTLTTLALVEDANKPSYQQAVKWAHEEAEIYIDVAKKNGVPPEGLFAMVAKEPRIQGPNLFESNCASCHRINGHNGKYTTSDEAAFGFDLAGFASREYLTALLDPKTAESPKFFGSWTYDEGGKRVVEQGEMLKFIKETVANYTPEQKTELNLAIKALSAEAQLPYQKELDEKDVNQIELGRALLAGTTGSLGCVDCHKFREAGDLGSGPDLTGYGSSEWVASVTKQPNSERFYAHRYGDNAPKSLSMPAFGEGEEALSDDQIGMLVEWMRSKRFDPSAPAIAAHLGDSSGTPASATTGDAPVVDEPAPAATGDATAAATSAATETK
ncbi:MAG TPA: cytochrome b N-terminal domain-containing protein [Pirellulales bacterium]